MVPCYHEYLRVGGEEVRYDCVDIFYGLHLFIKVAVLTRNIGFFDVQKEKLIVVPLLLS